MIKTQFLRGKHRRKTCSKPFLWLFLMVCILYITPVSAFEFDNVGNYHTKEKTIEIRNSVLGLSWWQLDTVANITLLTPHEVYVIRGKDRKVAEFQIELFEDYNTPIKEILLHNLKKQNRRESREIIVKYKSFEIIDVFDLKTTCKNITYLNTTGGSNQKLVCIDTEQKTTHKETRIVWKTFDKKTILPKGNIIIGLFTDVHANERIDWIPTLFGVEVPQWAVWTEALALSLQDYWSYNQTSGITLLNDTTSDGNIESHTGVLINMEDPGDWVDTGLKANALAFGGTNEYVNITENLDFNGGQDNAFTASIWVNLTQWGTEQVIWDTWDSSKGWRLGQDSAFGGILIFRIGTGATSNTLYNTTNRNDGKWHMITGIYTGTEQKFYVDGILSGTATKTYGNQTGAFMNIGRGAVETKYWVGSVDEAYFWNRALNDTEVSLMYDGGVGINFTTFGGADIITTTSNFPDNHFNSTSTSISFNCSSTATQFIDNVTLIIDHVENTTVTDGATNSTLLNLTVDNFAQGSHNWSCMAFDNNTLQGNSSIRNFTIDSIAPVINESRNFTLFDFRSLIWTFNATDEGQGVDTFIVNSTSIFQINQSGFLINNSTMSIGTYYINMSVNDTFGNIDSSIITVTIEKSLDLINNLQLYYDFNETSGDLIDTFKGLYNGTVITGDGSPRRQSLGILDNSYKFNWSSGYTNTTFNPDSLTNFSWSFWLNVSGFDNENYPLSHGEDAAAGSRDININKSGNVRFHLNGNAIGDIVLNSSTNLVTDAWYHIVITVRDSGQGAMYINGVLEDNNTMPTFGDANSEFQIARRIDGTGGFNGSIDEVGYWNKILNGSDIASLYASGFGLNPVTNVTASGLITTLTSPINNTIISLTESQEETQHFNFTLSSAGALRINNATLYLWYSDNNTLVKIKTINISGGITNSTFINTTLPFESLIWNVEGCGNSSATTICAFGTNRTITNFPFTIVNQFWANTTTEGDSENFILNLTVPTTNSQILSGNLIYNSTFFSGVIASLGGTSFSLVRNLDIPSVTANANVSFFWNIITADGQEYNLTSQTQTVNNINIDDCSSFGTLILNYTVRDEEVQDILNGTIGNVTFEIDIDIFPVGSTTELIEFSSNFTAINPITICIDNTLNDSTYWMNSKGKYESQDRSVEYHHLQRFVLTNSTIPQHINLYDLKTTDAQEFLITYKDSNFLPVEDALINIQRNYISEGVFKSVEIPKTDKDGETIGHFVLSDIIYTVIVTKNGITLSTFDNVIAVCDNVATGDCSINLNAVSSTTDTDDFTTFGNVQFKTSFDRSARTITTIFTTTDGSTSTINLNATKFDRFGNQSVCSDSLISSSGTLTCNIPASFGNVTVLSMLSKDNQQLAVNTYTISQEPQTIFEGVYFVIVLSIMFTIPLVFVTSTIGIVIGSTIAVIILMIMGVLTYEGFIGVGSFLISLIVACGILIYAIIKNVNR